MALFIFNIKAIIPSGRNSRTKFLLQKLPTKEPESGSFVFHLFSPILRHLSLPNVGYNKAYRLVEPQRRRAPWTTRDSLPHLKNWTHSRSSYPRTACVCAS